MTTTNKTSGSNTSSLQFNPLSQGIYNNLIKQGGNQLNQMIDNPFGNALYSMGAGQIQRGAQQLGRNNMGVLDQNQLTQGLGGQAGAGWLAAQRATTGRANTSMQAQGNVSNVLQALQRQMQATGMGMSFSPQLTGQSGSFNQTQSTGGLGTWLPQLLGAAGGAALGMAGAPGAGLAKSAAGGATAGAGGSMLPSNMFSGFTGQTNQGFNFGGMPNPFGMQSIQ